MRHVCEDVNNGCVSLMKACLHCEGGSLIRMCLHCEGVSLVRVCLHCEGVSLMKGVSTLLGCV